MRRLIAILGKGYQVLKIYESQNKLRGELFDKQGDKKWVRACDFYEKDRDNTEFRVREWFGFDNACRIPFERRNGKIILYPVDKQKRVICTNEDYVEWCEAMQSEVTEEEITPEYYDFCCETDIEDERANLDVEVDGYIVAFASLGLWNGRVNGAKVIGTNVKDILYDSNCDYYTWYCDVHNVRFSGAHHDGRNNYLYRVAKDKETAERLANRIAYHEMTEKEFRRATKSLRPYVAKVYGW